ncbi:MAG: hypothetical protein US99_C0064G0002 [Candidatus Daviesbacteria bacterium GW2011_GWF2_38_6]|uniref:Uncharacterized protein n=1 Tax=Candidatus Daviesbacteria bacterium GW2011_GWF2_38_6 TaxID=1618432 RepID=A0A0G0KML0_9BACT|nr:MAG: hypothetical protein US99_C0064G0002 [Candidatus Daviesbacteria bacterium GW2011_GWF2_38_6]
MSFDAKTKKILTDIAKLRGNNTLIPFIGAGFSANIDNLPKWKEFVRNLNHYIERDTRININLEVVFNGNWMEATEYFYWVMGKDKQGNVLVEGKKIFQKTLLTEFDTLKYTKVDNDAEWKQHILLIDKFKKVYTTNWDRTIENVAFQRGPGYQTYICSINEEQMIVHKKKSQDYQKFNYLIEIYKYHGCYKEVDSIVASESDYYSRIRVLDKNPLDHALRNDLMRNNFIFIGYDLNDINVTYFLNQVRRLLITNENLYKFFIVKLTSKSNIDKKKEDFYKEHKNIILVPLLSNKEQADLNKEIAKEKKEENKRNIKQTLYKQKIIEFLNMI